ncbi:hypothetical protein BU26DRAFT_559163 [Trematosphaeria pertusa]|uniref:Uncharacterized protein n=1 Tax=Trematosphaeria pertusa TaxID=390896 RepID=A0A6A6IZ82_9PLEO|nr:uncharacterized protein BU26DRAFT_559163 [Trematosphaeria pertusa]KAF2254483.1 hypothetical protein BU26DRAFT_559163 [Trematosphaeria pertusa]
MKLSSLVVVAALAVFAVASPQQQPPERPNPCEKCDKHYLACKESWWCYFYPLECEEVCQRDTCHFDEDCHEKCGYNKC